MLARCFVTRDGALARSFHRDRAIGLNPDWSDSSRFASVYVATCALSDTFVCIARVVEGCAKEGAGIYTRVRRSYIYRLVIKDSDKDGWREGGSWLHCSRWNPNVIHKGASHYLACICLTHTRPSSQWGHGTRTRMKPERDRLSLRPDARHGGSLAFTVSAIVSTWRPTAPAIPSPAIAALISHEIVKSPWE